MERRKDDDRRPAKYRRDIFKRNVFSLLDLFRISCEAISRIKFHVAIYSHFGLRSLLTADWASARSPLPYPPSGPVSAAVIRAHLITVAVRTAVCKIVRTYLPTYDTYVAVGILFDVFDAFDAFLARPPFFFSYLLVYAAAYTRGADDRPPPPNGVLAGTRGLPSTDYGPRMAGARGRSRRSTRLVSGSAISKFAGSPRPSTIRTQGASSTL